MTTQRFVTTALAAVLAAGICSATALAESTSQELADRRAKAESTEGSTSEKAQRRYQLGLWAQKKGLETEARAEFEAALKLDPKLDSAHTALGHQKAGSTWYTHAEAMKAKGLVLRKGTWLLAEEARILDMPATEKAKRKEAHSKVNQLLRQIAGGNPRARTFATKALAGVDDQYKLEPFAYALRSKAANVRQLAAKELGRLKNRRALRPLIHRAMMDPIEDVRHAAIDAAKMVGDANLIAPFVRAMHGKNASVRTNAAQAIGRIGDVRGVQYLVYKYEARGGGAPRVHFMDAAQLSFIQDFDVEVAQTAFIADPSVGVIQEGRVLDVLVVATSEQSILVEREAIHGALSKLTGATDVENKPGAWATWYRANKDSLAAKK